MSDDADDDLKLFREAVAGTRPLKSTQQHLHDKPKPAPVPRTLTEDEQLPENLNAELTDEWVDLPYGEISYARDGISGQRMRELRTGKYKIEAELDLHGLRTDEARKELTWFIDYALGNQLRCVRIIHGKGHGSAERQPVLKTRTASWLKQINEVLAYCSAPAHDGGTGAVYVLLKRT